MSVHQIIYTSCMRGINGINDGQQIFSYDSQFKDYNSDEIKNLFSYQPPALEPGVRMTEEIALTLPQSFAFRKFENGTCALVLNTYLGRDYMGSTGRFGNYLSHVVTADEKDITNYPCEFYDGSFLRNHMEFKEVNNPNTPDFLPVPVLEKGYTVDVDNVLEFISVGDRLETYKDMLYAMLAFSTKRRRIVICDEPGNIIMWIAALEYAIPLKMAMDINFTTYEFDPSLSASQICGVVNNGTKYTADSKRMHFVFDLYQNDCARFEKEDEFYDFIDIAFSLSFESMQDFHDFLTKGYTYEKADEELYSAYALYSLLSDGMGGITIQRMDAALGFALKYAKSSEGIRITKNLLSRREEILVTDKEIFLAVMQYIFSMKNVLYGMEQIISRNTIVDRILNEFLNSEITEDYFVTFYNDIDQLCKQNKFDLANELMQDKNREKLLAVIKNGICSWKIIFVIRVISAYVKGRHISISELTLDHFIGQTYYGIIRTVYSQNCRNGLFLVTCILKEFADDCVWLTDMTLNIEGMMRDLSDGEREIAELWKQYGKLMISNHSDHFSEAYNILECYKRHEQIYMLFGLQMQETVNITAAKRIFDEHISEYVQRDKDYASIYGQNILLIYYKKLGQYEKKQCRNAKTALLDLLVTCNMDTDFLDELLYDLLWDIPFGTLSEQDSQIIQSACAYIGRLKEGPGVGRLLLLTAGMGIKEIDSQNAVQERIRQIKNLTSDGCVDMRMLSERSARDYFAWFLPTVCRFCRRKNEINMIYELFIMSSVVEKEFFSECTKLYLRQSAWDKDYSGFMEFFDFANEHNSLQIREEIGKELCKLSKNRMSALDKAVRKAFPFNGQIIKFWEDVKSRSERMNPLFNSIASLLKKGRDN